MDEDLETFFADPDDFYKPEDVPTSTTYNRVHAIPEGQPSSLQLHTVGNHPLWGHRLWNASIITANSFDAPDFEVKDKCIIEFGAGVGLPSLLCALRGAKHVTMTDYADKELIDNLQKNVDVNLSDTIKQNVTVMGHNWGKDIPDILAPIKDKSATGKYDIVICADLIFNHVSHEGLVQSCKEVLAPGGVVYVVFTHHRPHKMKEDMNFFEIAKSDPFNFVIEKIKEEKSEPMFEHDFGPVEIRSTIHYYIMKHP